MNSQPLVSIPILTYNGEKYLREQLDSIFNQTYKNIEVLAFDDGSTDNTRIILKEYQEKYGLKVTINPINLGFIKNADQSFTACQGDYIAPADQDDVWKLTKIENLVSLIQDSVMIYTDSISISNEGKILSNSFFQDKINLIDGHNNLAFLFNNCISAHAMMFKRELLEFILPLPKEILFHDWWISFVAATYGHIKFIDNPLSYYRRHNTQVTVTKDKVNPLKVLTRLYKKDEAQRDIFQKLILQLTAFSSLKLLNQQTSFLLSELILQLKKSLNSYYNKDLEKILTKHQDTLFLIYKEPNIKKIIKKQSKGIWYYRWRLYT